MNRQITYKELDENDLCLMVDRIRPDDALELDLMMTGQTRLEGLRRCLKRSNVAYSGWYEDQLFAIFGSIPQTALSNESVCWMVMTDVIDNKRAMIGFIRETKPVMVEMFGNYSRIFNYVYMGNTKTIRWLKWLGFNFTDEHASIRGYKFLKFEMKDISCALTQ